MVQQEAMVRATKMNFDSTNESGDNEDGGGGEGGTGEAGRGGLSTEIVSGSISSGLPSNVKSGRSPSILGGAAMGEDEKALLARLLEQRQTSQDLRAQFEKERVVSTVQEKIWVEEKVGEMVGWLGDHLDERVRMVREGRRHRMLSTEQYKNRQLRQSVASLEHKFKRASVEASELRATVAHADKRNQEERVLVDKLKTQWKECRQELAVQQVVLKREKEWTNEEKERVRLLAAKAARLEISLANLGNRQLGQQGKVNSILAVHTVGDGIFRAARREREAAEGGSDADSGSDDGVAETGEHHMMYVFLI
jgi:hypothetical protein